MYIGSKVLGIKQNYIKLYMLAGSPRDTWHAVCTRSLLLVFYKSHRPLKSVCCAHCPCYTYHTALFIDHDGLIFSCWCSIRIISETLKELILTQLDTLFLIKLNNKVQICFLIVLQVLFERLKVILQILNSNLVQRDASLKLSGYIILCNQNLPDSRIDIPLLTAPVKF